MAVAKERVIARLKVYSGKANLSNVRIDEISARLALIPADDADDAAIDAVITNADAIFPFKEIAAQDDKVVGLEAKVKNTGKTKEELEAEAKKQAEETAKKAAEEAAGKSDPPDYVKTLLSTIEGLKSDITEIKTGKITETKRASAAEAFAKSEVLKALKDDLKPNWLNRIDVNSETPIEDQITVLETEYTTMAQSFADSMGYSGPAPIVAGKPPVVDDKFVGEIVDQM